MRKKNDENTNESEAGLQNSASAVESILAKEKNFLGIWISLFRDQI